MVGRYDPILAPRPTTPAPATGRPRAVAYLMLIGALGLSAAAAEAQQAARVDRSQPLEGRWSVELVLDSASVRNPPVTRKVSGELAFGTGSWWGDSDRFGRHNVNLAPLFGRMFTLPANVTSFGPGDTSMVTEVSGGVTGDSVGIDFLPRLDHGGVSLWGRFYGDSARGEWHRRGTDGSGRFVLRRLSKEPVAVAAIPVPGRAAATVATAVPATQPKALSKKAARAAANSAAKLAAKAAATTVAATAPMSAPAIATKATATATRAATATATTTAPAIATTSAPVTATTGAPASTSASAPTGAKVPAPAGVATVAQATMPAPSKKPPIVTAIATPPLVTGEESGVGARAPTGVPSATKSPASGTQTSSGNTLASSAKTATPVASPAATPRRVVPRGLPPQPAIDTSVMGSLHVRMFDKASKKYFATQYQLRLPDGTWMWGNLRSGVDPDGWGPVVYQRPGRYEVVVENFVCGDKFWFFAKKVLQPVVVRLGQLTDVTIDFDLSAEPARPTLDNKAGAVCTAGPGTPP